MMCISESTHSFAPRAGRGPRAESNTVTKPYPASRNELASVTGQCSPLYPSTDLTPSAQTECCYCWAGKLIVFIGFIKTRANTAKKECI